uniref:GAG-pre-integrase domain-containing protein n=1 Tax=Tanacetum cinerariifolium TaxID=118510 RepID=A0A6L2NLV8_TANCI|nr:hypothetical protein [Tanacetum cinerariifolium]
MVGGNGGNQFRQYAGQNIGNSAGYNDVIGNQNPIGNGNLVAARAEGNASGQNGNRIRCYNYRGYTELLEPIPESHQVPQNNNDVIFEDTSMEQGGETVEQHPVNFEETRALYESLYQNLAIEVEKVNSVNRKLKETNADMTTELARFKNQEIRFENCIIKKETEYAKLWIYWYKKCDECKYDKISYDKAYKDMQQKIERLQAQLGDLKGKCKDTSCVSNTQNQVFLKHENANVELEFQVFNYAKENALVKATYKNLFDSISVARAQTETKIASLQNELQCNIYKNAKLRTQLFKKVFDEKENTQDSSKNTKFAKQPIAEILPKIDNTQDTSKNTKFTKQEIVENLPKIGETNALSKPVTSNLVYTPQESKGVNNDKVISPEMFRINPSKTSREEKHVPNTVSASNRTKSIIVSQPPIIFKKDVNFDLNGLSSTGIDNPKTRRPQPKSNTKHDRVSFTSKSSRSKNKEAEVEEHHRNLLLSKNNKHISSPCNNIQIDSQDVISKVVCATCLKCLISVNHDKCLRNYVNGKNSRGKKQQAKVSFKENQMKYQPKVTKPKKVEHHKSLATPKPRKSRLLLRWSPTGKLFDKDGKIVDFSESKSQFDCTNGDNACTSNSLEPKIKRFPNSTSLLDRVYFIEGLGHNLFSVGQFCDSDLEVAFRRDVCFVRNLEGVDLLKRDRSTNLYTINLNEMASASPICLMARASSTKSWLWHQRLSHLNFDTINDLVRNDLVAGLPKFKFHKEHLCPSCEQGKSKRESHPPKPVPNSRQRLHLLHMDLCGPMRIASINGKWYVLVIVDDYSRYTWVHFLRSKDEAQEVIIKFLKRITAIATACFTQNRSIIHRRFNKTPYELINSRKPDISFLHVFYALCYLKNDREDIGKLGAKCDIETMNVSFDELFAMAFEQRNSKPELNSMTYGQISSGLDLTYALSTITTQKTSKDTTLIPTNSSSLATNVPITSQDVDELNPNAIVDGNTFVNPFTNSSTSAAASSSSHNVDPSNMHTFYQPYPYEFQWTKDHPLEQVIGEPSRPVLTRNQL